MKNIHVIPTTPNDETAKGIWIKESRDWCNIYITSDEKLPYDSTIFHTGAFYHIDFGGDVHIINKDTHYPNPNFCSRIILTTDESLFKYGVQAIDDEFLEWFVKNPSCEEVETGIVGGGKFKINGNYGIIIPSEIPKQKTLEEAAEKYFKKVSPNICFYDAVEFGVKWQQENSYSEEDLEVAFFEGQFGKYSFNDWLEQFKNK